MKINKYVFVVAFLLTFIFPFGADAFSLGVISDIHAGSQSTRKKSKVNTLYPNKFKKNLNRIQKSNIGVVLNLGDTTNDGSKKYADKVKKELRKKEVIWVKGNHDGTKDWARYGREKYYAWDKDNWRIIVLNTSEIASTTLGGLDDTQLEWLEAQLATDKKVLVAMHHCIWRNDGMDILTARYAEFKNIIEAAGNVRYVMSGHEHARSACRTENGIEYCSIAALSLRNHQGQYKRLELE